MLAGCGGGGGSGGITVQPARQYSLDFHATPSGDTDHVVLRIVQPDGTPLTAYKHGSGPHTGVHVIYVRSDLSVLVHHHPPVGSDGTIRDTAVLPKGGRYRVVVDAYPALGAQPNFQLFGSLTRPGSSASQPLPPPSSRDTVDGYRFVLQQGGKLAAIQPALLTIRVTRPDGTPARFTPWFGALAHAIFFRKGSLDYFHTHVCAPGAAGCTSTLGSTKVTGTSSTPGKLQVGVLVPTSGTWRLFLQCRVDGKVLTAPFTLQVK